MSVRLLFLQSTTSHANVPASPSQNDVGDSFERVFNGHKQAKRTKPADQVDESKSESIDDVKTKPEATDTEPSKQEDEVEREAPSPARGRDSEQNEVDPKADQTPEKQENSVADGEPSTGEASVDQSEADPLVNIEPSVDRPETVWPEDVSVDRNEMLSVDETNRQGDREDTETIDTAVIRESQSELSASALNVIDAATANSEVSTSATEKPESHVTVDQSAVPKSQPQSIRPTLPGAHETVTQTIDATPPTVTEQNGQTNGEGQSQSSSQSFQNWGQPAQSHSMGRGSVDIQIPFSTVETTAVELPHAVSAASATTDRPAPVVTASTPVAQPDAPELRDQANIARVSRALQTAVNQRGGNITLRLDPPELGQVRIEMAVRDGAVQARFTAQTDSVRRLLIDQMGQLRHALDRQGLSVERLDVQTASNQNHGWNASQDTEQDGRSKGQHSQRQSHGERGQQAQEATDSFEKQLEHAE